MKKKTEKNCSVKEKSEFVFQLIPVQIKKINQFQNNTYILITILDGSHQIDIAVV